MEVRICHKWQPGNAHESGRKTGGITTLVPKHLNQQQVQHSFDLPSHVYVHIVHIHGTGIAVIHIYAPPGEQKKMADLLMDVWISHNLGGYPWIAAGDTNETQDGQIAAALEQLEGTCLSTGKATRFEGKTEIDWFSTSRPHRCRNLDVCDEFKLSDHKIVSLEMLTSAKPVQRFRFCPQPKWNKPSFFCRWISGKSSYNWLGRSLPMKLVSRWCD